MKTKLFTILLATAYAFARAYYGYNQSKAAEVSGVSLSTFKRHLRGETNAQTLEILSSLGFDISVDISLRNPDKNKLVALQELLGGDVDYSTSAKYSSPTPFDKSEDPTQLEFWAKQ